MPYHTKPAGVKNVNSSSMKPMKKQEKEVKMPKPSFKPRKDLSKRQKDLMKTHKQHHSSEHLKEMRKLMKMGYCFEQAHEIAKKKHGK